MPLASHLRRAVNGKARWQPLFRRLHRLALAGRNYGEGDCASSGEISVLRHSWTARAKDAVVLDVGANLGAWTENVLAEWPNAQVHAFEPAAETFQSLVSRVGRRATCVNVACGAEVGQVTLHSVQGLPGLSSLYERDLSDHDLAVTSHEEVTVTTVDDYCASNAIEHVDFLKIDAEGHDLAVLQGAQRMLSDGRVECIQFEFGGANLDSRTYLRDFVRMLEPRYKIFRILVDAVEPLEYSEAEEVFVTSNFLARLA
jgi:FkbM family methyltransferase